MLGVLYFRLFWGECAGWCVLVLFWWFCLFCVSPLSFGFLLKFGIWVWESVLKFPCESWDRKQISTIMNALHLGE